MSDREDFINSMFSPITPPLMIIHECYNDDKDVSDSRKKFLEWKAKQVEISDNNEDKLMHWNKEAHSKRVHRNVSIHANNYSCWCGSGEQSSYSSGEKRPERKVDVRVGEPGELSIDGVTRPAGNIEVREYEDGEWVGGQYFKTIEEANEHVSRYLSHSLDEDSYYRD